MRFEAKYDFHYIQQGDRDNPAILFLHGFLGGSSDWTDVMARLSDKYLCVAVDLPGHGRTAVTGGAACHRMKGCAAGIVDFMDALKPGKWNLAGYSMGGRLAAYLAVCFEERFEKVVIESASPGLKTRHEREKRIAHDMALARLLEAAPLDRFLREWYAQPLFSSLRRDKKRFERLLKSRLDNNKAGLAMSLRMMGAGAQPSLWQRLHEVKVPILLIVGEADDKFQEIGREVVSRCSAASMGVVRNAGHNVHLENLQGYVKEIISFLSTDNRKKEVVIS